jgi:hypothetical protein
MVNVTMVLAQGPGQPEGNLEDRIHLHVSLTPQGHLDATAWETGNTPWLTDRERSGQTRRSGELVKIEDGWALRELDSEDDPLYSLSAQIIRPGELVSVSRLDGDEMIYRIVAVEPG